jgi:hypothetical protein
VHICYLRPEIARLDELLDVLVSCRATLNARDHEGRTFVDRALTV